MLPGTAVFGGFHEDLHGLSARRADAGPGDHDLRSVFGKAFLSPGQGLQHRLFLRPGQLLRRHGPARLLRTGQGGAHQQLPARRIRQLFYHPSPVQQGIPRHDIFRHGRQAAGICQFPGGGLPCLPVKGLQRDLFKHRCVHGLIQLFHRKHRIIVPPGKLQQFLPLLRPGQLFHCPLHQLIVRLRFRKADQQLPVFRILQPGKRAVPYHVLPVLRRKALQPLPLLRIRQQLRRAAPDPEVLPAFQGLKDLRPVLRPAPSVRRNRLCVHAVRLAGRSFLPGVLFPEKQVLQLTENAHARSSFPSSGAGAMPAYS